MARQLSKGYVVVLLYCLANVVSAEANKEELRAACTQQAAEAGMSNPADVLEYVAECVSLLSQNNEPAQDIEAQSPNSSPIQN